MPIGIQRASEYAGWWANQTPRIAGSVSFIPTIANPFPVQPRYYVDNPSTYNTHGALFNVVPASVQAMDMTGITTNGQQITIAYTMRFGTNFLSGAANGYGLSWYDRYAISSTQYFPNFGLQATSVSGAYNLFFGSTGIFEQASFNNFSSLRNTWLGMICSVSNTSSSFSSFTAQTSGRNTFIRMAIVNVETGELIQQTDISNATTPDNRQLTNQYYWDVSSASTYSYEPFLYPTGGSGEWDYHNVSDFDMASIWVNWGSALDPAVYYSQLVGSAVSSTVGGQQAWFANNFDNATNNADGYTSTVMAGSRAPYTVLSIESNNFGTGSAAQLVSF